MTYTTHTKKGVTSVFRTLESKQRASLRAVKREPTFDLKRPILKAQDVADEKHLSRSKEYPNKGANEAKRRLAKMDRVIFPSRAAA